MPAPSHDAPEPPSAPGTPSATVPNRAVPVRVALGRKASTRTQPVTIVGAGLRPIRPALRPEQGPSTAVPPPWSTPWAPPPSAAAPSRSRRDALSAAVRGIGPSIGSAVRARWPCDRRRATVALLVALTLAHGVVLGWMLGHPRGAATPANRPFGQHAVPAGPPIPTVGPSAR